MGLINRVSEFFDKYVFCVKWKCNCCGKEIFDGSYFCSDCESKLPFIKGSICDHCGREVTESEQYCSTCKEYLTALDKGRSAFNYDAPIKSLIFRLKYRGKKYIADIFADYLAAAYFKNYLNADLLVCVPMSAKAERRRGYNQSELLARKLSEKTNVPFCGCVEKKKDTSRQATLSKNERMKNLVGAFSVTDKAAVKGKRVLVVDDVSTTGATAQVLAEILKKAGAKEVFLLSVASVPPKRGY